MDGIGDGVGESSRCGAVLGTFTNNYGPCHGDVLRVVLSHTPALRGRNSDGARLCRQTSRSEAVLGTSPNNYGPCHGDVLRVVLSHTPALRQLVSESF